MPLNEFLLLLKSKHNIAPNEPQKKAIKDRRHLKQQVVSEVMASTQRAQASMDMLKEKYGHENKHDYNSFKNTKKQKRCEPPISLMNLSYLSATKKNLSELFVG